MTGLGRSTGWLVCGASLLLLGCQTFPMFQPVSPTEAENLPGAPSKHYYRVSQFVFLYDFDLDKNHPLFRELSNLRDQVFKELQLPPSNHLVQIYLFEDKDRYERFMKVRFPQLPNRRAFFVAQQRRLGNTEDLQVFTYWSDRIHQDLRHELTHALIHSVIKNVPLWLDEGLAEFFEMPPGYNGVNYQHLDQLKGPNGFQKLDLARLEEMTEVKQMGHAEYRDAWAWTHLMLRSTPKARQVLIGYLHDLRTQGRAGSLQPRLAKAFLSPDEALQRHLADLDRRRLRSTLK